MIYRLYAQQSLESRTLVATYADMEAAHDAIYAYGATPICVEADVTHPGCMDAFLADGTILSIENRP